MRTRRMLASLAAVVAASFALAGCALLPVVLSGAHKAAPVVPKTGECWNASNADAAAWADWEGGAAVSCAKSHVLYTYAVGKVSGDSSKTWATSGSGNTLSKQVEVAADDVCSISVLLPKLKWNEQLVQGFFFVPTEAQWKAGARWIRCDVGVLGYGATLDNEVFAKLPPKISTLVSAVSSDPEHYDFCVNSPVPISEAGPLDNADARIADCSQNPQWALVGHGNLPELPGAAYPSNAVANTETSTICSKYATGSNEAWIAYLPSKSDWKATNERDVDCWVGQKSDDGNGSAGSA
jgi:hypothetical protein